jgi:SAM-dependent methyltransferase
VSYSVSEACERNKGPILEILVGAFARSRSVLEIGSGTGQHAAHFAAHLPHLIWQPSDTGDYLPGLCERIATEWLTRKPPVGALEGAPNLRPPLELDVRHQPWPVAPVDAIFTANTLHIMGWAAVQDLFRGVGAVTSASAVVCIYGPFRYGGRYTSASNAEFDRFLRSRDPESGIRDFEEVNTLSSQNGLSLLADHAMPANNQLIIWHKRALSSQTIAP